MSELYEINLACPEEQQLISVNKYPWDSAYRPHTAAKISYIDDSLHVYMRTNEWPLRALVVEQNGAVYTDSCMELFLMPVPGKTEKYINIEINPLGVPFISVGISRKNRYLINVRNYKKLFSISSKISEKGWELSYRIPLDFLHDNFGEFELLPGYEMRANFYKCGDNTIHPHYGCWSEIDLPAPDFHCPNFFGRIVCR